jgi:hypothetical protein
VLRVEFEGWFQCRLATDPDPWDEPRGISGWTFALPGEPDLDRVIRFHDPVPRRHAPPVSVTVRRVLVDGEERPEHPLRDGRVELLDGARFEGRNGLVAEDGLEPILPFRLRISGGGMVVSRIDPLDPEERPVHEVDPQLLLRQFGGAEAPPAPPQLLQAIGIPDLEAHRREREERLRADLDASEDEVEQAALGKRLAELGRLRPWVLPYGFDVGELGGSGSVEGDDPALTAGLDLDAPWPVHFWLGGWDADALCGYAHGRLEIPLSGA